MRRVVWLLVACALLPVDVSRGGALLEVIVAGPYLELHTGPGRAYPVTHVAERGARLVILRRRTGWYKVRVAAGRFTGREGWAPRAAMARTRVNAGAGGSGAGSVAGSETGIPLPMEAPGRDAFSRRRWELGALGGDFEGANVIALYGARGFSPHLSVEISAAQVLGEFSDSLLAQANVVMQPFPRWRASPFFTLGTGIIDTNARKTVVEARDSTDQLSHVGVGLRFYLGQRFLFRAEYRNYVIFTSKDDNKEIDEWRGGFAFFL